MTERHGPQKGTKQIRSQWELIQIESSGLIEAKTKQKRDYEKSEQAPQNLWCIDRTLHVLVVESNVRVAVLKSVRYVVVHKWQGEITKP